MDTQPDFWTASQGFASKGSHIFTKDSPDVALCGYALVEDVEVVPLGVKVHADCDTCNHLLAVDLMGKMMTDLANVEFEDDETTQLDPLDLETTLDVFGKLLECAARLTPLFGHEDHPAYKVYVKTFWATKELEAYLKEQYPDELAKWFEEGE